MRKEIEVMLPEEIEKRSFEMITSELGDRKLQEPEASIIKRVIHTSADFEYVDALSITEHAIEKAREAIKEGAWIVTDTNMAKAGINKKKLAEYGGEVHCFMADEDVAKAAKKRGVTRATLCMEKIATLDKKVIVAIGNAPTALIKLYDMIEANELCPELIIGVPVGFVNVVESKELIMQTDIPHIVARGRKGGSNIAAAICNAILYGIEV